MKITVDSKWEFPKAEVQAVYRGKVVSSKKIAAHGHRFSNKCLHFSDVVTFAGAEIDGRCVDGVRVFYDNVEVGTRLFPTISDINDTDSVSTRVILEIDLEDAPTCEIIFERLEEK